MGGMVLNLKDCPTSCFRCHSEILKGEGKMYQLIPECKVEFCRKCYDKAMKQPKKKK